jgi:hypothetical protein
VWSVARLPLDRSEPQGTMVYFIHDLTNRAIKIGHAWDPAGRLAALRTSNPNDLVLLGSIPGMKKAEQQVHMLVYRHCGKLPGERSLRISGEWFDDHILPFATELVASPATFIEPKPKKPPRVRPQDGDLRNCTLVLVCDSGESFRESFTLKAASPDRALAALTAIATARLAFLSHAVRITRLVVPGCRAEGVDLRGAFAAGCNPRHGLAVTINAELQHCLAILDGVKQYQHRWLHGVPPGFYQAVNEWHSRPTAQCEMLLSQFARVLNENGCVIVAQTVLPVRGVFAHSFGSLPKGDLRSKVNRKAAGKRRPQALVAVPKLGAVYFIEDTVTAAIKVGFCLKNPGKRLAALQTGNANPLRLIGHVAGSEPQEKLLHRLFSTCRIQGEWFSNAIIAAVKEILKCPSLEDWMRRQDAALSPPRASAPVAPAGPDPPA